MAILILLMRIMRIIMTMVVFRVVVVAVVVVTRRQKEKEEKYPSREITTCFICTLDHHYRQSLAVQTRNEMNAMVCVNKKKTHTHKQTNKKVKT